MAQIISIPKGGSVDSTPVALCPKLLTFIDGTIGVEYTIKTGGCYRLILDDVDAHKLLVSLSKALLSRAELR